MAAASAVTAARLTGVRMQWSAAALQASRARSAGAALRATGMRCVAAAAAKVSFKIQTHVEFGQEVHLTGADSSLGVWNEETTTPLTWHEGDVWTCECNLHPGPVEYKYVVKTVSGELLEWQPGTNRQVTVPEEGDICVEDSWEAALYQEQEEMKAEDAVAAATAVEEIKAADAIAAATAAAEAAGGDKEGLEARLTSVVSEFNTAMGDMKAEDLRVADVECTADPDMPVPSMDDVAAEVVQVLEEVSSHPLPANSSSSDDQI